MSASEVDLDDVLRRTRVALASRLGDVEITDFRPLLGGFSSITYSGRCRSSAGDGKFVVKLAPPGLEPVRNRDVLRQARVLAGLQRIPGLAVPAILGTDRGSPPEVPPLFVMSFVEGESFEPLQSSIESAPDRSVIRTRAFAAARMQAALHGVDRDAVGLANEQVVTLNEELDRWERAFATVDRSLSAGADRCFAALRAGLPAPVSPSVLHGDFRLGNMLCLGPEIRAVIDWEIWSIGDYRCDLAWFLLLADPRHAGVLPPNADMPTSLELLQTYEDAAGARVEDFEWFEAVARLKLGATVALIVKNRRKRNPADAEASTLASRPPASIAAARRLLGV